jgi:hypothetical protein
VDARVVLVSRLESAVLFSFFHGSLGGSDKVGKRVEIIEIDERERFVRQHQGGAAVDYLVNQHAPVAQPVAKLFDFVSGS